MENIIVCTTSHLNEFFSEFENRISKLIQQNVKSELDNKELLTAKEVCELLRISNTTLHKWCKIGKLLKHKMGHPIRFKRSEVNELFVKLEAKRQKIR